MAAPADAAVAAARARVRVPTAAAATRVNRLAVIGGLRTHGTGFSNTSLSPFSLSLAAQPDARSTTAPQPAATLLPEPTAVHTAGGGARGCHVGRRLSAPVHPERRQCGCGRTTPSASGSATVIAFIWSSLAAGNAPTTSSLDGGHGRTRRPPQHCSEVNLGLDLGCREGCHHGFAVTLGDLDDGLSA